MLLLHAKNDSTVPWQQSRDLHHALTNAGVPAEIKLYPAGGHGVWVQVDESRRAMIDFFRRTLVSK